MRSKHHMCVSVRGVLRWPDRKLVSDWSGCITDDTGKSPRTAYEIREFWMDHLSKGHEVIPLGEPCEGFDYGGKGCPGHPIPEDDDDGAAEAKAPREGGG